MQGQQIQLGQIVAALLRAMWEKDEAQRMADYEKEHGNTRDYKESQSFTVMLPQAWFEEMARGKGSSFAVRQVVTGQIPTSTNTFLQLGVSKEMEETPKIIMPFNGRMQ